MRNQIARNGSGSSQTLLPVPLPLTHQHQIHMVIVCNSDQRSPSISVQYMNCDVKTFLFELSFVGFQLFNRLTSDLLQQLIVLFCVNR